MFETGDVEERLAAAMSLVAIGNDEALAALVGRTLGDVVMIQSPGCHGCCAHAKGVV